MLGGVTILEWLREYLAIYTWWEFWLIIGGSTMLVAFWLLFAYFLAIPNTILRTVSIWGMLFLLTAGAATVDAIRRHREKS